MMHGDSYSQHVVVLDGVPETTEVLQAMLEPRGIRVSQVHAHACHSDLCCDLIVVHDADQLFKTSIPGIPRIFVDCELQGDNVADFSSPFDYGDLLSRIQELLEPASAPA